MNLFQLKWKLFHYCWCLPFPWIYFKRMIPQVSRLVGDIRRGPAWGPLAVKKKNHFNCNDFISIATNLISVKTASFHLKWLLQRLVSMVSRLVGDIRKGPAWGPLAFQGKNYINWNDFLSIGTNFIYVEMTKFQLKWQTVFLFFSYQGWSGI